jgi:predicted lysophospholipase L1 biosynthesis ABC-type transport system permease subunit
MNDPTPTPPQWSRTNVLNAIVVAALSAGVLACQLYADLWPKQTAIAALFLIVFASIMRLPISSVGSPPQINVERAETVTQNNPPADPPSSADQSAT